MIYRQIGTTDLEVSEVGFGVWTLAMDWWGKKTDEEALALLQKAYDLGINFYDAADVYGEGRSERLLGEAFHDRREMVVIATKFGYDFYDHPKQTGHGERPQNWSPEFVRKACDRSLERLQTDYIDLYQLHNPKMEALKDDRLWQTLEALRDEGKIRHFGVALGPAIGWREEGEYAIRFREVAALQTVYNLLEQDPGRKFFTVALETNAGVLVRVPHASGILDGTLALDTELDPSDHRAFRTKAFIEESLQKVETFKPFFEPKGMTMGQAAIKFCLAEETVPSVLPNIYNEAQLEEFAAAPEMPDFSPLEIAELAELYRRNFGVPSQTEG